MISRELEPSVNLWCHELFDHWADLVADLLLPKSSVKRLTTNDNNDDDGNDDDGNDDGNDDSHDDANNGNDDSNIDGNIDGNDDSNDDANDGGNMLLRVLASSRCPKPQPSK